MVKLTYSGRVAAKGWEEGTASWYSVGAELQFGKMERVVLVGRR